MSGQLAPAVYSRLRKACIPEAFEVFVDHLLRMNLLLLLRSLLLRKLSVVIVFSNFMLLFFVFMVNFIIIHHGFFAQNFSPRNHKILFYINLCVCIIFTFLFLSRHLSHWTSFLSNFNLYMLF